MRKALRTVHSQRLARWLGEDQAAQTACASRGFYWPLHVGNVPGEVFAYQGEFYGYIRGGGFTSLSDLIAEATTGGKRQDWTWFKVGTVAVTGACSSHWRVGNVPSAAGAASAIPAGDVPTRTTTGALGQSDAAGGDTLHFTTAQMLGGAAPNTLLIYDRIWQGQVLLNTTAAQSITGVPTRYATTTSPGNFCFMEVTTTLGTGAHTWTLQYVDQAGNAAENAAAITGISACVANRIDEATAGRWFIPLNAGDSGLRNATQITLSATIASGVVNIVIGHPLIMIPCPVSNSMVVMDGINSAFNLVQVLDGAAIAGLEIKGVATATTFAGTLILVSG